MRRMTQAIFVIGLGLLVAFSAWLIFDPAFSATCETQCAGGASCECSGSWCSQIDGQGCSTFDSEGHVTSSCSCRSTQ